MGPELLGRAEQAGGSDGEQRPELEQVVLHGRARDGHLELGREHAGSPTGLGRVVLDELRLVEEQARPLDGLVVLELSSKQPIGGDHEVGIVGDRRELDPSAGQALGDGGDGQARGEPLGLGGPVSDHAGRCHDEEGGGSGVGVGDVDPESQSLEGLSETHVIGQDPAETVGVEVGQPAEAIDLVGPKRGVDAIGDRVGDRVVRAEQIGH